MRIGFLSARDDVEGDLETVHKIEFPETRDFTLKKKKKIVGVSRKFKNQRSNLDLIFFIIDNSPSLIGEHNLAGADKY